MDPELQRQARAKAAELGISFAEYVRRAISKELGDPGPTFDITQMFDLIDHGLPPISHATRTS